MSRDIAPGAVDFEHVVKEYRLGKPRAFFAAAWPAGTGVGRGPKLRALDDVSFRIDPGDAFALIGANGAGKSTALKCLAGVARPTSGSIRLGGRVVALIELGIGFHPDLTGLENARFAATMAGLRGAAATDLVDRAIEFSEIERFMGTPVKRYSSGMFARLSFGITANLPAEVLIVDEILAVGDLAFQRKCHRHLSDLRRREGVTLVFVSHTDWVLKETCRTGVFLDHGKVAAQAPINELLEVYHASKEKQLGWLDAERGQRIRLDDVDLVPAGTRRLPMHGPLTVTARVDVADGVDEPVVGIGLFDSQGRILFGLYSDQLGIHLGPGSHRVTIGIDDMPFPPGTYRFEMFAFERGSPQGEDGRKFEIDVEGDYPHDWEHGVVHLPSTWSTEPLTGGPGRE